MWFASNLNQVEFRANQASYRGGGAYAGYAGNYQTHVEGGTFLQNSAAGGGGLYSDSSFTISGTQVISNTSISGNGGGAWTPLNASLTNVYVAHNTVITAGNSGGVDTGGSITITHSTFYQNQTLTGSGGGSGAGVNATLDHVTYDGNTAYNLGGGLIVYGSVQADASQFTHNHSQTNWGGAIFANQNAVLKDTQLVGNDSTYAGGGLALYGTARVTGGRFEGNSASAGGWGGAIYSGGPSLTISGTQFIKNSVDGPGGATASGTTTITNTLYVSNTAGTAGGGAYVFGPLWVSGSLFQGNTADTGGGLQTGSQIHVSRTSLIANTANNGGGIYQSDGDGSIVNTLFSGNQALSTTGEALYLTPAGTTQILQTTIASPTPVGGSALLVNGGVVELVNTIIANHSLGILQTAGTVNANTTLFYDNVLNIQGGGITNSNPRSGNPAFFNPSLQDYHLGAGSAAVNSGANSGLSVDFDGDSRPQGSGYDIGYDESVPPEGLSVANDSPTRFGSPTTFSASVTFGQAVSFSWNFGDGSTASGSPVEHVYATPGSYPVTVTAANGAGSMSASTTAQVVFTLYLPVVENQ